LFWKVGAFSYGVTRIVPIRRLLQRLHDLVTGCARSNERQPSTTKENNMSNQHQSGKDSDHSESVRSSQGSGGAQKSGNQGSQSGAQGGNQQSQTPKDGNTEGAKPSGPGKT
jgi:hypothetical protein